MNKKIKLPVCKNMKEAMELLQDEFQVLIDVKEFIKNELKKVDENGCETDYDMGYNDALEQVRKTMNKSIETNINGGRY